MPSSKPVSPETMKKIISILEEGKKSLDQMKRILANSDANAEKIEKANQ